MTKRISKKVREEAALICAANASTKDSGAMHASAVSSTIAGTRKTGGGTPYAAAWLAFCHARGCAEWGFGDETWADAWSRWWAEAEALLRTGWTP